MDKSLTSFNYLIGGKKQQRTNVPGYYRVRYAGLYRGIDLLSWGERNGMKYEFHVAEAIGERFMFRMAALPD